MPKVQNLDSVALSFKDYSQVMIGYLKPTFGSHCTGMVGGKFWKMRRYAMR